MKKIGSNIRRLRQSHNLTQKQLAADLQVQFQTISKWETGVTVPDTAMLPNIADYFNISIDELFSHNQKGCPAIILDDDVAFLLQTYSQMYSPEAGPWNLSVVNKYLEYRMTEFFETHFKIGTNANICNIGIGAGEWDRYLAYQLKDGTLTSIDKLEICCQQLKKRLEFESNPGHVEVLCADVMTLELDAQFDIVTMIGTTVQESKLGMDLIAHIIRFIKPGGTLYYQSMDENEDCNVVIQTAIQHNLRLGAYFEDSAYNFVCHYYKFDRT